VLEELTREREVAGLNPTGRTAINVNKMATKLPLLVVGASID
jgi:hypothetical protein